MILIIDRYKKNSAPISEMFYYMGVLSKAISINETFSEISPVYRAIILISPERFPDIEDYLLKLREYNSSAPIFAMGNPGKEYAHFFDDIFSRDAFGTTMISRILDYTGERDLPQPGDYRLAGIDISCDIYTATYFSRPLPFTKTEAMIVRYMIITYPRPLKAEEILKYSFRDSRTPEISNIRTHISIINKKFRKIAGRNLIQMLPGEGYRILTPALMSANT